MARDPYTVLGVSRSADEAAIKSAYRKLAKKWHPDTNKDNARAKERFAEANQAYEILGDAQKRQQFDRGEIDETGAQKGFSGDPFGPGGPFSGGRSGPGGAGAAGGGFGGAEDILREMFGNMGGGGPQQGFGGGPQTRQRAQGGGKPAETKAKLTVTIADLAKGDKIDLTLNGGKRMAVAIPPGTRDGDTIRLRGQGEQDHLGRKADLLLEIGIRQQRHFRLSGADIIGDFHAPLDTAILGGKARVETPAGSLSLTIPAWSNSGKSFRIKGKGLPKKGGGHGDLLLSLLIDLPEDKPEALSTLVKRIQEG